MALSYSIREGLAGFRRAKFAAFTSTSAMAVALVLIGLSGIVAIETQRISSWLRQRAGELEIFVENAEESVLQALFQRAAGMPGVAEAEYVSPEEAQAIFSEEFGEGADIFFDQPFLPASIKVRVEPRYANPDSLTRLAEEFESWNRVDEVVFNRALLIKVQQNLRLLTITGLSLGILVVLASLFLVANTIRLTIYARRLLIRTMKLVGATDKFIRQPFLVEGIAQGALAGLAASGLLWLLYMGASVYLPQIGRPGPLFIAGYVIGLTLTGGALGWFGSLLAVRRFIKKVALH